MGRRDVLGERGSRLAGVGRRHRRAARRRRPSAAPPADRAWRRRSRPPRRRARRRRRWPRPARRRTAAAASSRSKYGPSAWWTWNSGSRRQLCSTSSSHVTRRQHRTDQPMVDLRRDVEVADVERPPAGRSSSRRWRARSTASAEKSGSQPDGRGSRGMSSPRPAAGGPATPRSPRRGSLSSSAWICVAAHDWSSLSMSCTALGDELVGDPAGGVMAGADGSSIGPVGRAALDPLGAPRVEAAPAGGRAGSGTSPSSAPGRAGAVVGGTAAISALV